MSLTATLLDDGAALRVAWPDGATARFHALWLRDNALDEATRSPGNGQRLITLQDVAAETKIAEASESGEALDVTFQPEGKTVTFPTEWLRANAYDRDGAQAGRLAPGIETWDSALDPATVSADFNAVTNDAGARRDWLAHVRRYGFCKARRWADG